jgi:hypothetical protein
MLVKKGLVEIPTTDPYMRSFLVPGDRGNVRVNVWHNSKNHLYTVGTYMDHQKKGKTQLFRKHCTEDEVKKILANPRVHTGKGYR